MNQTIKDAVPQGRIGESCVPVLDGDLGGYHGGGLAVAIIQDLEQISGLRGGERIPQPVIEDEQSMCVIESLVLPSKAR